MDVGEDIPCPVKYEEATLGGDCSAVCPARDVERAAPANFDSGAVSSACRAVSNLGSNVVTNHHNSAGAEHGPLMRHTPCNSANRKFKSPLQSTAAQ